jgi:quercetin dioxygenase-like cupin family protein
MNRHRILPKALGALGALLAVITAVQFIANATPPSGLTNVLLARGVNTSHGTIPLQVGTGIVMAQITVDPGGSSGWHSHPGGAIVVAQKGSLTVYRSIGSQCQVETYGAGQAFIERPGEVDQVINTGSIPYILFVTFPRVPQGDSPRIDVPDPGTCPGV